MTQPRLKVLQIITGLGVGGAERFLLDLMGEFDRDRLDVRLALLADDVTALRTFNRGDTPVEVFALNRTKKLEALRDMRRFLTTFAPDIIHAHMFHSLAAAIVLCATLARRPSICFTSHCFDEGFPPMRAAFVRATRSLRQADIVFQEGQHPQMNAAKTLVIKNGVIVPDKPLARPDWRGAGKVRLIAVGRLADQKDPLGLIRSVAALGDPRVHLDFFGEGPLRDECRTLIAGLGLESRVRLRGVSNAIRSEMQTADILVMHSRFEGMPIALLEAGAEAMPVVATPAGAVPAMLAGGRGALTPAADFTATLAGVIAAPDTALEMGLRFYDHVRQHHSIALTAQQHGTLYREIGWGCPAPETGSPALPIL